jgi:hypothetical protein
MCVCVYVRWFFFFFSRERERVWIMTISLSGKNWRQDLHSSLISLAGPHKYTHTYICARDFYIVRCTI